MSDNSLLKQLKYICDNEKIKYEEAALEEIVVCAEGSMRDGINILDKVRTYSDDNITLDDVRTICGKPNKESIKDVSEALISKNVDKTLEFVRKTKHNGYDAVKILNDIILYIKSSGKQKNELLTFLIGLYDKLAGTNIDPFLLFEIELCGYCSEQAEMGEAVTTVVEKKIENVQMPNVEKIELIDENELGSVVDIRINNAFCSANKEILIDLKAKWKSLEEHTFDKKNGSYVCELLDGEVVLASDANVVIAMPEKSICVKANNDLRKYEELIEDLLNIKVKLCFVSKEEWNIKKEEYILNKKKGVKYNYIEEKGSLTKANTIILEKDDVLSKKINELFD